MEVSMAVLEIRQYPDPVLKGKCRPVEGITPELRDLIEDMFETMYAAPGVGLAAPQVGVPLRLCVMDVGEEQGGGGVFVLINPEIIELGGEEVEAEEGCLSVKDRYANVTRYSHAKVRAMDRDGNEVVIEGGGLLGRALQHELDHLDGVLFLDRMSPLKRDLIRRKIKKAMKEEKAAAG
jgi:peptide deformylase